MGFSLRSRPGPIRLAGQPLLFYSPSEVSDCAVMPIGVPARDESRPDQFFYPATGCMQNDGRNHTAPSVLAIQHVTLQDQWTKIQITGTHILEQTAKSATSKHIQGTHLPRSLQAL